MLDDKLVAAGIKAVLGNALFSEKKTAHSQAIDATQLFHYTYPVFNALSNPNFVLPKTNDSTIKNAITLTVSTLEGKRIKCKVDPESPALQLVEKVSDYMGIYHHDCIIMHLGKMIKPEQTFKEQRISDRSVLHLLKQPCGGCPAYHIEPDFFAPGYNYDFTEINDDHSSFTRGGKKYTRPVGSKRYAIKVNGKYSNDKWLRCDGNSDEWPVAYHGTQENNSLDITKNGFDLNKCKRFLYGEGIYCAPDPDTAKGYATEYDFEGKKFCLIFQTRVNPKTMNIVKEADPNGLGEYWTVSDNDDIRPYGICVYPL